MHFVFISFYVDRDRVEMKNEMTTADVYTKLMAIIDSTEERL